MKSSIFNLIADLPNSEDIVLFNTLTFGKAIVDSEIKHNIESGKIDDIKEPHFTALKDIGAIIEDDIDEKVILKVVYERDKNNGQTLELGILPTFKCNLSCPFCYRTKDEFPERNYGKSMVDRVIQFAKNTMIENRCTELSLGLTGGEPLLELDKSLRIVGELHSWCVENGVKFGAMVGTNGTLITQEIINAFSKYPVRFCISLDGPKHINDKRRPYKNGKGTFDDIIRSLKLVKESGMLCRIATTVDKHNLAFIDEFLDELVNNGLQGSNIVFGPTRGDIGTCGEYPPDWITENCFEGTELPKILPSVWEKAMKRGFNVNAFEGTFHENPTRRLQFIIGVYGDMFKSCGGVGSGKKDYIHGYLDENGNMDYTPVNYQYMSFDIFSNPECRDCNVLPICQGKINSLGLGDDGMMYRGDCSSFKELLKACIIAYLKQSYPENFAPELHS